MLTNTECTVITYDQCGLEANCIFLANSQDVCCSVRAVIGILPFVVIKTLIIAL